MTRSNTGMTTLRRRIRSRNAMQDYDRLPPELRAWLAQAALPWRSGSAHRIFARALAQLDAAERRLVARDAAAIWGERHPAANMAEMTIAEGAGHS
jgi:hypothetical protein